jgi:hypothetical protein
MSLGCKTSACSFLVTLFYQNCRCSQKKFRADDAIRLKFSLNGMTEKTENGFADESLVTAVL